MFNSHLLYAYLKLMMSSSEGSSGGGVTPTTTSSSSSLAAVAAVAWSARPLVTALLGAVLAVALQGPSKFVQVGDAEKLWYALVSQHFFYETIRSDLSKQATATPTSSCDTSSKSSCDSSSSDSSTRSEEPETLLGESSTGDISIDLSTTGFPSPVPLVMSYMNNDDSYDWEQSTEYNHRQSRSTSSVMQPPKNYGPFAAIRDSLDQRFHAVYSRERQIFQDSIIESFLNQSHHHQNSNDADPTRDDELCFLPSSSDDEHHHEGHNSNPWIVFSAGAMGAGKTWTVKLLEAKKRFPLQSFVTVDPDQIRQLLPEFHGYIQRCPENAGELTRKECGMISELLIQVALQQGKHVLVDGSLRNASWYQQYFTKLRQDHPSIRIAILHVTAPREVVLQRALMRSKVTGRVVPHDLLLQTIEEVPLSFATLRHQVDFAVEIRNAGGSSSDSEEDSEYDEDVELVDDNMDWHQFRQHWWGVSTTTSNSCDGRPSQ